MALALAAAAARARRSDDSIRWLTRAYFVSYAVGQVLPTSVGGDASRIYETTQPPPGARLADRRLGAARAGARRRRHARARRHRLRARDRALPDRRRTSGSRRSSCVRRSRPAFVVLLAPAARAACASRVPLRAAAADRAPGARRLRGDPRLPRPRGTLARGLARSRSARSSRAIVAIWASGRAVGIHLSIAALRRARPAALPGHARAVHVNGLGVREAFFVSFLGQLGVGADSAFATAASSSS